MTNAVVKKKTRSYTTRSNNVIATMDDYLRHNFNILDFKFSCEGPIKDFKREVNVPYAIGPSSFSLKYNSNSIFDSLKRAARGI